MQTNFQTIVQENFLHPRSLTRKERYEEKIDKAQYLPITMACVNFMHDGNLAFIIRAAVCFGVKELHVIGSVPSRAELRSLSGTTVDFINIIQHSTPRSFIDWSRKNNVKIVAAELCDKSVKLRKYSFDFTQNVCIFTGHETTGVPGEIIHVSDCVEIDMPGPGFCLNTAQAANIVLYEASKQYLEK
jgi:tRNA G18 (ribose-2'-O)-methylase SpoU